MRQCALCGKSYKYSIARKKVRSKYNPVNVKKTRANLQWIKLSSGKRVRACVRCIKTLKKKVEKKK
jgi:ribosomal protein L28